MALTKEDLSDIKSIVTEVVTGVVDERIEKLALQVGEGFNEVTTRFEKVDKRLARLETDVREIKWDLGDTVRRAEFVELRERVVKLEERRK